MGLLKNRSLRFYLGLCVILVLAIGGSIAAFADTPSANVMVNAGNFTETGPTSVSANAITLNGTDQTATYSMDIAVVDDTGSGSGWNLTITSTTFSTGNCTSTGHNLSTGASSVTGVTMAENGTGTFTYTDPTPDGTVHYPITVPANCTVPTAVKLYNASAGSGLGHFKLTPSVNISIPANTYAGTYTSTVTLAIVTGP